jgi:hypothetical protein
MDARDADGQHLRVTGVNVEEHSRSGSVYDQYPYVVTFEANDFGDAAPPTQHLSFNVLKPTEPHDMIDALDFEYDTVECSCVFGNY